jgi:hypothetical protein
MVLVRSKDTGRPMDFESRSVMVLSCRKAWPVAAGEKLLAALDIGDASRCVQPLFARRRIAVLMASL